jgi:hypothetical protein
MTGVGSVGQILSRGSRLGAADARLIERRKVAAVGDVIAEVVAHGVAELM